MQFTVPSTEAAKIEELAKKSGMKRVDYLRRVALYGLVFRTVVEHEEGMFFHPEPGTLRARLTGGGTQQEEAPAAGKKRHAG